MSLNKLYWLAFPAVLLAAPEDRIKEPVDAEKVVALKAAVRPEAIATNDRGALDGSTAISGVTIMLRQSEAQAADLAQFLEEQRNPASPDYQRWLTPEEFGERFGLSQSDLGRLTAWIRTRGLDVETVARGRNWIGVKGTAEQLGRAFHTELRRYEVDGEKHFANSKQPHVPAAFAEVVETVLGLDDFRPKPQWVRRAQPDYTGGNGAHYLAPDDLATIYNLMPLYQAGFDGTGQKIVIPGQTDVNLADIRAFRSQFNLPARDPQVVLYGADPGVSSGDQVEANLDLEWSGAVARNATIIYVNSRNVFASLQYAVDQNLAPVISLSYGACEMSGQQSFRTVAQQANAQGITWMNASGDSGAAGCDWFSTSATHGPQTIFPANIPEVTAVGGTEFNETAGAGWNATNNANGASAMEYIAERAWNDSSSNGLAAGGGGVSAIFPKPWWQTGPGMPSDGARDVPDVALTASGAHDGYIIYAGGLMPVGGTSAASPSFAGIVALINQYVVAKGAQPKAGLGNINPNLYNLAQNTTGIFHDITVGDNIVPCTAGSAGCTTGSFGYKAGAGYDLATGLGSVDGYNLVTRWTSLPPSVGTTMTLAASAASIDQGATVQLTATIKPVTGTNPPAGSVAFKLGGTTLGSAAVTASGANGTAVLSAKGSSLAAGSNTITASYSASGNFGNSTATVTVTVNAPTVATTSTLAAAPASIAQSASTVLTVTVKAASGSSAPAGSVTFAAGANTLGSATLSGAGTTATASLTVKGTSLAGGDNTITANYAANSGFAASSATVKVTVTVPAVSTTVTVTATPSTVPQSSTTQVTANIKAASGTTAPTGNVSFSIGTASLGSAPVSGGAATLAVRGSSLALGANTITATFTPSGSFAGSTGMVTVIATAPVVATSTVVAAAPASIAQSASTVLTATVKAASGSTAPGGTITFSAGSVSLGTASLTAGSSGSATATLTVKGASLVAGNNAITASYSGSSSFGASSGALAVSVAAASGSNVVAAVTPKSAAPQIGWGAQIQLQEKAGVATTVTGYTINGLDFGSMVAATFGSTQLPANGTLTANIVIQWKPLPASLVFVFNGVDAGGRKWTQTVTVSPNK